MGPDAAEFEAFHPEGGSECGALEDLMDVFGHDDSPRAILAEHGKLVGWSGLPGCHIAAGSRLDRTEFARDGFMGDRGMVAEA